MALVAVVVSLVVGNYEHVDAVRRALRIVLCMPGRTDGHFSLGLSNGERLRQLLNSNRETERERGSAMPTLPQRRRRRRRRLSMQWDMLHFLQQLLGKEGQGGETGLGRPDLRQLIAK